MNTTLHPGWASGEKGPSGAVAPQSAKLYGRAQAVHCLQGAFDDVCKGAGTVYLLPGSSGAGKTSLARALRSEVERRNGFFLEGKFEQYHQYTPYFALRQALGDLCARLPHDRRLQSKEWKQSLQQAVGGLGQLVLDLEPEFEQWLGPQPAVPEINPLEARYRFAGVVRDFLRVFCRPDHPVVLFLDDWQWADAASLELLTRLQVGSELRYLLLLAAYRDDEVDARHPLRLTLAELPARAVPVASLPVGGLSAAEVGEMLADVLQPRTEQLEALAALLYQRTGGNPFFTRSLVQSLREHRQLWFDSARQTWCWGLAAVEENALPASIVGLFGERLSHLDPSMRELLSLAACLGNQFDLADLALVSRHAHDECRRRLEPAVAAGLLVPQGPAVPTAYRFLHDRVQQAAFDVIGPAELPALRLRIGRVLRTQLGEERLNEQLFQVTEHLNAGAALIEDEGERVEAVRLNLRAGRKARAATAYRAALRFHRAAAGLLERPGFLDRLWTEDHALAHRYFLESAESEFLEGEQQLAEAGVRAAVAHAGDAMEKAEALSTLIVQFTLLARYPEAIAAGREALAALGIHLPETEYESARDAELAEVRAALRDRPVAALAGAPVMTQPATCMAVRVMITMGPPCYRSHQRLWSVLVTKVVNLTIRHGNVPQVGYSHPAFGGLVGWVANDYAMTREFGAAATRLMSEVFDSAADRSVFYLMIGSSVRHWSEPLRASSRDYAHAYEIGLASGNLQYAAYAFGHNMYCRLYQGTPLPELIQESQQALDFSRTRVNRWAIDLLEGGLRICQELADTAGEVRLDEAWENAYFARVEAHQNIQVECIHKVHRAFAALMLGQAEAALVWSDQAEPLIYTVGTQGLLPWAEHVFVRTLILARLAADGRLETRPGWRAELDRLCRQLQIWAEACPANFAHKHALAAAELAVLEDRPVDAMRCYRESAELAAAAGIAHWQGMAHERMAAFLESRGQGRLAQDHWQSAHACYTRWGAKAKLHALEAECYRRLDQGGVSSRTAGEPPRADDPNLDQELRREQQRQLRAKSVAAQQDDRTEENLRHARERAEALERLREEVGQRTLAEAQLVASLEEKTVLLREVHHRVKNNLQVIVSLLNLQSDRVRNPDTLQLLSDLRNRIRSMALLHETLYRSGNLTRIHLPKYLETLCRHLWHVAAPRTTRVRLQQRIADISLAMDQAVPCGLVVNELVTNALKYAYPDGPAGEIRLHVAEANGTVSLTVADDGVGLPPAIDVATAQTLGLRLVFLFAQHLRGTVTVARQGGTEFRLTFQCHYESPPKT